MIPQKSTEAQIDQAIETDVDRWVETKYRELEQIDFYEE